MLAIVILEAVAVGLLALLVAGLLRSHAEILRQLHHLGGGLDLDAGPTTGGARPVAITARPSVRRLSGKAPDGETVSVALDRPGAQTLLLFLSSGCGTCGPWWEGLRAGVHRSVVADGRVLVVARDADEESPSLLSGLAPPDVTVVLSSPAWEAFAVPGSPYAVLVDESTGQVMGEGVARTWEQLQSLVDQHLGDLGARPRPGRPRPEARADEELQAAGIVPGHPSLSPEPGSWTRKRG